MKFSLTNKWWQYNNMKFSINFIKEIYSKLFNSHYSIKVMNLFILPSVPVCYYDSEALFLCLHYDLEHCWRLEMSNILLPWILGWMKTLQKLLWKHEIEDWSFHLNLSLHKATYTNMYSIYISMLLEHWNFRIIKFM